MRNPILSAALAAAVVYVWGRLWDWYREPAAPGRDAWDHLAKRDRIR